MSYKDEIPEIAARYASWIKVDAIDHPSLPQCESLLKAALVELAEKMEHHEAVESGLIPRISKEEQERREESGMCNDL